jgi:hypothetical protein
MAQLIADGFKCNQCGATYNSEHAFEKTSYRFAPIGEGCGVQRLQST